jgi:hypothetical protein
MFVRRTRGGGGKGEGVGEREGGEVGILEAPLLGGSEKGPGVSEKGAG